MAHYEHIVVEARDDVLWVRVNRPQSRNALSRATLAELGAICAVSADSANLKAMVLTGEGSKAFAAGGDLKELSTVRSLDQARELWDSACAALDGIRCFPVPVVAALNGLALGGGAELALACDFRIAAADARIGYIQATINVCSGFGGGADLMRLLGHRRGLLHGLKADVLGAADAIALGLIDEVASPGETLDDCVDRFLRPILGRTPHVIRAYKAMALAERQQLPSDRRRDIEREWFCRTWTHDDHWSATEKWTQRNQVTLK